MENVQVKSVDEFHVRVSACRQWNAVFRGESVDSHSLKPKLGRYPSEELQRALEREEVMLEEFKKRAQPFLGTSVPSCDWDWLALGQHHGLATRLLDWTENPLVAAFFAVHDQSNGNAVVYALNEEKLEQAPLESSPFSITKPCLYRPPHVSPRIAAQAGVLTAQHDLHSEFQCEGLQRWIIVEDCKIELDVQLHQYGVHPASVFPGLDGVAKHVLAIWMAD